MLIQVLFVIFSSTLAMSIQAADMSLSQDQDSLKNVFAACSSFTNILYKNLSTIINDNVVTSPLSLHMILSLLVNGADGTTLDELKSVLHHNDSSSLNNEFKALIPLLNNIGNLELHIANSAYIQDNFELMADFLSVCTNVFQSSISRVNFKDAVHAVEIINSWVKEATNEKIPDIISAGDIDEDTKVILLNAIYFKSKWQKPFDPTLTQNRKFHISKTEANLVPMMFKKSKYVNGKIPAWHSKFIEIPYLNQDVVMIILLPDEDVELQTLEDNFDWKTLAKEPTSIENIELYLPKFKFEITLKLKETLRKIGLKTMFEDIADFRRLSKIPLKVGKVLQKVFIEVNEEGSEAAAASDVMVRMRRMTILEEKFVVDRPFMFMIQHKPSKIPLFLGSVRKIKSSLEKDEL
ncbi:PREDICTED: leukocyte elastase inhibitor-like isoform X2 [Dinoponera quadriceps]|uniref:Leukocyte elastase inhibitor-like isoform X2 n=1 Tax=Dinoponera quadriceps TaxID=609295 RepID=A0A6P3XLC4_DINQU|nr:PREDICTED: leukocyte elastase inhibitor-like isoform X2 [Dinoponera quadriceps]